MHRKLTTKMAIICKFLNEEKSVDIASFNFLSLRNKSRKYKNILILTLNCMLNVLLKQG